VSAGPRHPPGHPDPPGDASLHPAANSPDDASAASHWRDLQRTFLTDASRALAVALSSVGAASEASPGADATHSMRLLAHRLRGSAGFFGLEAIGACAAALEDSILAGHGAAEWVPVAERLEQELQTVASSLAS
jgi:HPt (histidine-containing phosphotransfer) domain-containing protein